MLGIAKAYATRVGGGPFPTELPRRDGRPRCASAATSSAPPPGARAAAAGSTSPALRLAIRTSGIDGLALTKLDVLAGLEHVRLCVAYRLAGSPCDEMPLDSDDLAAAEPVYEELQGWPVATRRTRRPRPPRRRRGSSRGSGAGRDPRLGDVRGAGARSQTIVTRDPFAV